MNKSEMPNIVKEETGSVMKERLGGMQEQGFAEMYEKPQKNDIVIGELGASSARDLLYKNQIKFEYKLMSGGETVDGSSTRTPREFIFRLDNQSEDGVQRVVMLLKEAKIKYDLITEATDLDNQK